MMENEFQKIMSERSDSDLIKIVTVDRGKYTSVALEAADTEISKRQIDKKKFDSIKENVSLEVKNINKVNRNTASKIIRLTNFLVDFFVCLICAFCLSYIIGIIFTPDPNNQLLVQLIGYSIIAITFFFYYFLMESNYQKTLGKYLTKTKVVRYNGKIPNKSDIRNRTLCRFIPFDRISFIFTKNGIHDFLTETKVIKDDK